MVARQIQILSGALLYYGLVLPLSYLPLRLLYIVADVIYLLLCMVLPYRKKVINHNLNLAFTEKTPLQRKQIRKDFYRYFADLLVELLAVLPAGCTVVDGMVAMHRTGPIHGEPFLPEKRPTQLRTWALSGAAS